MRTIPFRQVFNRTARWMGFNPNKEISPDERDAIVDRINDRVRTIWSGWPWPEWMVTEQRAFRQIWNDARQYLRDDGTGHPDEVFYLATESYYRVLEDAVADPPIGTVPTDTNFWIPLEQAEVGTYIAYDQGCRRSIGQVSGVFRSKPSSCGCNGSGGLKFHPSQNGIEVCGAGGPTVYINYRMPVPKYSMEPYAAGHVYNRADTVIDSTTGECYQALLTTINAPGTTDWSRLPFLEVWEGFVVSGAYADALNELNQSGNAETQVLELKAVRAENRAMQAVESEVDALRFQGQMLEWNVCKKNGYWCESLAWSGGDVIEISEECESGIVFPVLPPPGPPPSGFHCPTPDECPEIAYLGEPNVFRNVNQFPGIRYESRDITEDYILGVIDFEIRVDCSAGPVSVFLPLALGSSQCYYIKKIDATINPATLVAQTGDLIDGLSTFVMGTQYADIAVIDGELGTWDKFGAGIGDTTIIPDLSDFARKSLHNVFLQYNTFNGVQFTPRIITEDDDVLVTDFGIGVLCTDAPIVAQLPPATGTGQLLYFEKLDDTDEVVTIQAADGDFIGGDLAVSVNFVDKGANAFLYDMSPNYWSNVGPDIEGGIQFLDPLPAKPNTLNEVIALLVAYGMCEPT